MEPRDPSPQSLELQMQAFYDHWRSGYSTHQPSPLQQQSSLPEQQQQQHQHHHLHQLHYQQLQRPHHQQQQHLNPSVIHNPSPLRQMIPNPNLNNPIPGSNFSPSPSSTSVCHPSEIPTHAMPHQSQAGSPGPPSGLGVSSSATAPASAPPMVKKKRGRPRKYGPDANDNAAVVIPLNAAQPVKKKSIKKAQMFTSGTTGEGFTPHVLTIGAGEDITAKIMTFLQHGPWAVCILSANGVISTASLWHSGISSSSVTYEGRYEILSLSGLFLLTQDGPTRTRSGGISVSLAGPDGSIIGGRVAGILIAATPTQVVVGTFFPQRQKNQGKSANTDGSPQVPSSTEASQPFSPVEREYAASGPAEGHVLGPSADAAVKEHSASHVMPLQAEDWGGSNFDVNTRSHSD